MSTRTIKLGAREIQYPSDYLQELNDSSHLLGSPAALREELQRQGYLLVRGLHARDEVQAARLRVLRHIEAVAGEGGLRQPWQDGILHRDCGLGCVPVMEGMNDISHSDEVLTVIEGPRPRKFFESLIGEPVTTFDYKWLRGVHHSGFTGAHVDRVYMCWGSESVYTMWTPLDDVIVEMGTLAMCEGSHALNSFAKFQETYGSFDVEKGKLNGSGWFTTDPFEITDKFGGQWKTTDFRAGDVMVFPMRTVHMSTVNETDKVRISCDTRWQASSKPLDVRYQKGYIAESSGKFGMLNDPDDPSNTDKVTMDQLREQWGLQ